MYAAQTWTAITIGNLSLKWTMEDFIDAMNAFCETVQLNVHPACP